MHNLLYQLVLWVCLIYLTVLFVCLIYLLVVDVLLAVFDGADGIHGVPAAAIGL